MAIKVYKKNNAGRRGMSVCHPEELTDDKPYKPLLKRINNKAGRSKGKISVRHRGGGGRKMYRMIDFKFNKQGVSAKVVTIEKDPNRNALIALLNYPDGEKRYVLATKGMKKGDVIFIDKKTEIKEGNRLEIKHIPVGTEICNVEMIPGGGAQLARSAGASILFQALDEGWATLKMPSGEIRMVRENVMVTIGQISNFESSGQKIGKAGRKRHMGRRPKVRGSAMNPVDHPHGGGEGRQPIGLKYPKTPWGKPALGVKTRKKNKASNKYILKRRKKRKR